MPIHETRRSRCGGRPERGGCVAVAVSARPNRPHSQSVTRDLRGRAAVDRAGDGARHRLGIAEGARLRLARSAIDPLARRSAWLLVHAESGLWLVEATSLARRARLRTGAIAALDVTHDGKRLAYVECSLASRWALRPDLSEQPCELVVLEIPSLTELRRETIKAPHSVRFSYDGKTVATPPASTPSTSFRSKAGARDGSRTSPGRRWRQFHCMMHASPTWATITRSPLRIAARARRSFARTAAARGST